MSLIQLNPTVPVHVLNKGNGYALALIDYSAEHDLLFVVAIDETGEIWTVSNKEIRMQKNITLGRTYVPNCS